MAPVSVATSTLRDPSKGSATSVPPEGADAKEFRRIQYAIDAHDYQDATSMINALPAVTKTQHSIKTSLIGDIEYSKQNYQDAAAKYREALALAPNDKALAICLGYSLYRAGQSKQAIDIFQTILPDPVGTNSALDALERHAAAGIAQCLYDLSKYADAKKFIGLALAGSYSDQYQHAEDLAVLAAISFGESDYVQAETFCSESVALLIQVVGPDDPETLTVRLIKAGILRGQEKYAEADKEFADIVRRQSMQNNNYEDLGNTWLKWSLSDWEQGKNDSSLDKVLQARKILARFAGGQTLKMAEVLNQLGAVAYSRGELRAAKGYMEECLTIRKSKLTPPNILLSESYNNLAAVLRASGKAQDALPLVDQAVKMDEQLKKPGDPAIVADLCNKMKILMALKRFDDARSAFRDAKRMAEIGSGIDSKQVKVVLQYYYDELVKSGKREEASEILKGLP